MAYEVIAERVIDHGQRPSACPCGCGGRAIDERRTRVQVVDITLHGGREFRALLRHESVDGGSSWHGATQIPFSGRGEALAREYGLID